MTRETKRKVSTAIRYTLLILVGFIMVYPLIWICLLYTSDAADEL